MRAPVRLLLAGLCALVNALPAQAQDANFAARGLPNPSGLRPMYPAGISSGSGAAQSTSPVARANSPVAAGQPAPAVTPGVGGAGRVVVPSELFPAGGGAVATTVLGAAATTPGPSQHLNSGAGGVSATDEARSFFFADANHDGELSRAEAARLSIATMSFEQMDRNFDGVISRFEYQDSLR